MQKYSIIHPGRCGSQVLGDLLNQHPLIAHHGEIFTKDVRISPSFNNSLFFDQRQGAKLTIKDHAQFVEYCSNQHAKIATSRDDIKLYGYETKISQIFRQFDFSVEEYVNFLAQEKTTPVFLVRKNTLRRIISLQKGFSTGVWHHRVDNDSLNKNRLKNALRRAISQQKSFLTGVWHHRVDNDTVNKDQPVQLKLTNFTDKSSGLEPGSILEILEKDKKIRSEIESIATDRGFLLLKYEDFSNDPKQGAKTFFNHFGLEHYPVEIKYTVTRKKRLENELLNYDELAEVLSGTEYEWMMADDA